MIAITPGQIPSLSRPTDTGFLIVLGALIFTAILAHRLWRGKIRAEDERAALQKDAAFSLGRYRMGFRKLKSIAAFVDRATGLVVECSPGWVSAGFAEAGRKIWGDDAAAESAWKTISAPDAEGHVGGAVRFVLGGRSLEAEPLDGTSLGIVLVQEIL